MKTVIFSIIFSLVVSNTFAANISYESNKKKAPGKKAITLKKRSTVTNKSTLENEKKKMENYKQDMNNITNNISKLAKKCTDEKDTESCDKLSDTMVKMYELNCKYKIMPNSCKFYEDYKKRLAKCKKDGIRPSECHNYMKKKEAGK